MSPTFRPYDAATAFIHADVSLFLILGILMPSALYVIMIICFMRFIPVAMCSVRYLLFGRNCSTGLPSFSSSLTTLDDTLPSPGSVNSSTVSTLPIMRFISAWSRSYS